MAANPYRAAIKSARHVDRELARMFALYLGSVEHPRGQVVSAYRSARRAMRQAYRRGGFRQMAELLDTLRNLRQQVMNIGAVAMLEAAQLGQFSADLQVMAYQEAGETLEPAREAVSREALMAGWAATIDGQIDVVQALILSEAEEALVLGDEERGGALQAAPIQREGSKWLAYATAAAYMAWLQGRQRRETRFRKQAVAVIDNRTTDCCLRVHGQIVDMNGKFVLTGTPRFADRMAVPPFHWYCRSSLELYKEEFDVGTTTEWQNESRAELRRRSAGN